MNNANALGFLCLGTIMNVLPFLGVGAHPADPALMSNSALWLHFMGMVTGGVGGAHMVREASREVTLQLARFAQRRAEAQGQLAAAAARNRSAQVESLGVRVSF